MAEFEELIVKEPALASKNGEVLSRRKMIQTVLKEPSEQLIEREELEEHEPEELLSLEEYIFEY